MQAPSKQNCGFYALVSLFPVISGHSFLESDLIASDALRNNDPEPEDHNSGPHRCAPGVFVPLHTRIGDYSVDSIHFFVTQRGFLVLRWAPSVQFNCTKMGGPFQHHGTLTTSDDLWGDLLTLPYRFFCAYKHSLGKGESCPHALGILGHHSIPGSRLDGTIHDSLNHSEMDVAVRDPVTGVSNVPLLRRSKLPLTREALDAKGLHPWNFPIVYVILPPKATPHSLPQALAHRGPPRVPKELHLSKYAGQGIHSKHSQKIPKTSKKIKK